MKHVRRFILFAISGILVMSSCSKKEDKGDVEFFSNGSASGSISGTLADNTPLNEQFSYNKYLELMYDEQYVITAQGYEFTIYFTNPDASGIYLKFILSSATDNTPDITKFGIDYYKSSDNSIFYFWMNNNNTFAISNFSFDEATGRVKCKVTATGTNNSTGKNATIIADYDLIVKKIVY